MALRPELPEALSRLILRLLEKEPDERYQSANAWLADLHTCQEQLASRGHIDPDLVLATSEIPGRPRFVRKVYGREREIERLRHGYTRAAAGGPQLVLITGDSGSGRSSLVEEVASELVGAGAYVAVGKFDASSERPHAAWTAALEAFVEQCLIEPDHALEPWRAALCASLGAIAQAAADLAPALAWVLGEVSAMPALGPRETEARHLLGAPAFRAHICHPGAPIGLFLDDLQWSDATSRTLLEELLGSGSDAPLLLIGAYRVNEVMEDPPLRALLLRLQQRNAALEQIELASLCTESIVDMLAQALERSPEDVRPLAEIVGRKTGSSPLFVRKFIEHLHERGLLEHSAGSGWAWDAHAVGDEFDLDLLCELSSEDRAQLDQRLHALSDGGLIDPSPKGLRFAHDPIREAARALLRPSDRARLHYEIAQFLRTRRSAEEQGRRLRSVRSSVPSALGHRALCPRGPLHLLPRSGCCGRGPFLGGVGAAPATTTGTSRELALAPALAACGPGLCPHGTHVERREGLSPRRLAGRSRSFQRGVQASSQP